MEKLICTLFVDFTATVSADTLLLRGATVHTVTNGTLATADVLILDGKIAEVAEKIDAKAEPEVRIDAPDVDAHRAIARQFLSQIGASEQAPFLAALEQHSEHWWQAWLAALRRTTHLKTWQHFRQQALQRTLSEALDRQSFSAEIKSRILEQVQRTRPAGSTWKLDRAPTLAFEALDDQRTRQLALAVIGRMNGAEIRQLRLPLGRVIDALENSFH